MKTSLAPGNENRRMLKSGMGGSITLHNRPEPSIQSERFDERTTPVKAFIAGTNSAGDKLPIGSDAIFDTVVPID